jgi:TonB-dependent starch-binding outer membrane protein SusC
MMNATEFAQFKKESYEDLGVAVPDVFQNPSQYGEGTDWYGGMLQTAPIHNYSVSLSSSKERFSTSATAGYFDQDGVMLNSNYKRFSLRINSEFKVNDKIKVGLNVAPAYSINNIPSSDGAFYAIFIDPVRSGGLLYNALLTWPLLPYKNEDGTLPLTAWIPGAGGFPTPNWYRSVQEITNTTKTSRLLSNAYIEYQPIQGLSLKSSVNVDLGNERFNNFNPTTASTGFASLPPITATAVESSREYNSWLWENTATYKKIINNHNFELLAGYTAQKFHSDYTQIRATDFPDDRIHTIQTALNIDRTATFDDRQEWSLLSYIGRLNYNYKGKYILTAAIRRDGSSRFGADNKWGNFPSVSAGWVVSDEDFMQGIRSLSFLKVRASYGVTGNNNIGNYTQYANVSTITNAIFGSTVASGASVTSLSNANLGWETTKQVDAGLDLGLFNNRINFSYDFYIKKTSNLLYNVAVPQESGFSSFTGNIGELKFWGHEFTLSTKNLTGNFKWNTDINVSVNKNKVLSLAPGIERIYSDANITMVGQPLGLFYGLIHEGVYVDQGDFDKSPKYVLSQVGTIKFKDVNGDGVITYGGDADDRTVMGNPWPKFLYGITNSFAYKNFDLTIVGSGSQGNDILRRTEQGTTNLDGVFNVLADVKDRWRSPEDPGSGKYGTTKYATFMERDFNNSRFVSDGSFFTIKNITLGYSVPLKNSKLVNNVRVYASAQQVYVFTQYPGVNPEVSTDNTGRAVSALNQGNDWGTYPVPRTYTFGVNVGL